MDELLKKSQLLEDFTERYLIDPNGVVYSGIHSDTLQPWTKGDFKPSDDYMPVINFDTWEVLNYENAGMTTGAYLAAQTYRYRVTNDKSALAHAGRCFEALQWIYDLGKTREEGYFPKPYGGRLSHEISTDQYLYAIKGMMAYRSVAPPDHQNRIARMVTKMVDFWVGRGYRHDYFTIKNMLWPLGRFPSLLLAAYVVSGEDRYRDEAYRLNKTYQVHLQPTDVSILKRAQAQSPFEPFEKMLGGRYLGLCIGECATMDIMELDECLEHCDDYRDNWLKSMRLAWREGLLTLTGRGLGRQWLIYDPVTGEADSPEPQSIGGDKQLGWRYMQWISGVLTPRTTMLARVGAHVAHWLPDEQPGEIVRRILELVSLDDMRHNIDPDGNQLLPEHRFLCKLVDVDAIVNWLWAYWQGRHQSILRSALHRADAL